MRTLCVFLLCATCLFAQQGKDSQCNLSTDLIKVKQVCPVEASVNTTYMNQIELTAIDNAADVMLSAMLGENVKYVKSEPAAKQKGNILGWYIPTIAKGQTRTIKVWLSPQSEGNMTCCVKVTAVPYCCASTFVGKAVLAIVKDGPPVAKMGDEVCYDVTVQNVGNTIAKDVKVTDIVPEGLYHPKFTDKINYVVGDLKPGEKRTSRTCFTARKRGKIPSEAFAVASNAEQVDDPVETVVMLQKSEMSLTCPKISYVGKRAVSGINVRNAGDTPLKDIVLTGTFSKGLKVVSAEKATQNTATNVVWNIPTLDAGKSMSFEMVVIAKEPGEQCVEITGMVGREKLDDKKSCCTMWHGFPAFLIELIDTVDPLLPTEPTQYIIRITNQGSAKGTNIVIKTEFPAQVDPKRVSGSTQGKIEGRTVTFAPYPVLQPKEVVEFRIDAVGVSAGDARIRTFLYANELETPVPEEESTHVY